MSESQNARLVHKEDSLRTLHAHYCASASTNPGQLSFIFNPYSPKLEYAKKIINQYLNKSFVFRVIPERVLKISV